ncbi:chromatin remodeling protein, putative [Medicago truncatula]|uniref:Chromatin remodeling protein, putative n=1 Tax=Medicago truncatula TaxID=3880 RepID=G7JAU5_MEDTR|nr:chromatin remodeling protein, putative [Medicago truncatula]
MEQPGDFVIHGHENKHNYKLDEEIGIYTLDALKVDEDDDGMISTHATDPDELISKENDKVWKLIQEIKGKMHACQKKVFEFPWQNITGSTEPSFMKEKFKTNGGYWNLSKIKQAIVHNFLLGQQKMVYVYELLAKAEKNEDDILRDMVEENKSKAIHMIMKNEKASTRSFIKLVVAGGTVGRE